MTRYLPHTAAAFVAWAVVNGLWFATLGTALA